MGTIPPPGSVRKGRERMKKKYVSAMVLTAMLGMQAFAGQVQAAASTSDSISIGGSAVYGIDHSDGTEVSYTGEEISIANITDTGSQTAAVRAGANSSSSSIINLGGENTKNISISINETRQVTDGLEMGLFAQGKPDQKGGQINVKGENLSITGHSEFDYVYGIISQNFTTDSDSTKPNEVKEGEALININTENTYINVSAGKPGNASGLVAMSNGNIVVNSNLEIHADNAIVARGDAVIEVNKDGAHSTKLYGNVKFDYDGKTSGTAVDATVDINLTGEDSVWEGNSLVSGNPPSENLGSVSGFKLAINDGAQWTTDGDSFVNALSMDGGIINIAGDKEQAVTVTSLEGSGTVNMKTEKTESGFSAGTLNVIDVADGKTARLGVNFTGINADDITDAAKDLGELAGHVKLGSTGGSAPDGMSASVNVAEGFISGAVSADMAQDGGIKTDTLKQAKSTSTMDNMKNIAAVSIAAWRQEDSTLSQRLGDLRETTGGQGIWARVSRGEFQYSGEFKNQYNYFQIGWDMAKDDWHYGAAVSYNDGETAYSAGHGENSSTSLSLYGTRLLNDGQYFDLVLKAGRLTNKYDNYAEAGHTHGDYDAWGTEISGEYGKKIDLSDDWFVTPQAQLSLMRIGSEDYTTDNGIHVDQDTLYSAVGRIGAEVGKKTGWGSLYAKASVLHDFAGDADTYLTYQGISNSYSQDIGDTWYEAGFGANWKMSASSYLYVDVVRTFGGDIKTPWQWNAGVRWGF